MKRRTFIKNILFFPAIIFLFQKIDHKKINIKKIKYKDEYWLLSSEDF